MTAESRPLLPVVAGILYNEAGGCLLSSRPKGKPYAGYWEFAGGKVEAGESDFAALQREFAEELGISIRYAVPWLCTVYNYEHARVRLRFFRIPADGWSGTLQAKEGQSWRWQTPGAFDAEPMLPANGPLLAALSLPQQLSGSPAGGFSALTVTGTYRVVPAAAATAADRHLLTDAEAPFPDRPCESLWRIIRHASEAVQTAAHADVLVWPLADTEAAESACALLEQGLPVPLVLSAPAELCRRFTARWLAAGAQAVTVLPDDEAV